GVSAAAAGKGSPGQRIVLYAKDRGCSHPGCDVPGYRSEVHHLTPYSRCRTTDVNELTLACGSHHPLAEQGWNTRTNRRGDTEWIPPAHLDHGQPRTNTFHHPEKLLIDDEDDVPMRATSWLPPLETRRSQPRSDFGGTVDPTSESASMVCGR